MDKINNLQPNRLIKGKVSVSFTTPIQSCELVPLVRGCF